MSILMYKSIHGMAPAYLCNEITLHSEIAERTTRSVNNNNNNNVYLLHAISPNARSTYRAGAQDGHSCEEGQNV